MKILVRILLLVGVTFLMVIVGCEEKPPLLAPIPDTGVDTAYVEISPSFSGFNKPQDILIGNDQLLYVADTDNDRVVMMNRAGQILSQRRIIRPISIAQDSRLDLLVGGLVIAQNGDSAGSVFRIHLVDADHHLELARIDTIWRELAFATRRFPGITVFGDNTYLVVRDGPHNESFIDPDARVLQFDKHDNFITPLPGLTTRAGSGISDIYHPTAIISFSGSRDFILTQGTESGAYGALWLLYQSTPDFEGWLPKFDPAVVLVDFLRVPRTFFHPEGVTIDKSRRDIFIADAGLDSVFKFNSRGVFKVESFGRSKSAGVMKKPTGLAFFDRVLYVLDADATGGKILRYRLTTDVQR